MEFYVDAEVLKRNNICTHISRKNEFEPGVRCYVADPADNQFTWGIVGAMAFGVIWTLGILWLAGRL